MNALDQTPFNPMWQKAEWQFHNIREMDRHTSLFKCFTCNAWFDAGMGQLDLNFKFISKEPEICPIAQAMMFDGV